MKISIRDYRSIVKKWAKQIVFQNQYDIVEEADFGSFYGFAVRVKNKYNNAYLCIDKKTLNLFTFNPAQDIELFKKRTILQKGD